jgi:hypothetical protein
MKVTHAGNADHDGREDDRSKQHPDQFDEEIPERLELRADIGVEVPKQNAGDDADENLYVELGKRFPDR